MSSHLLQTKFHQPAWQNQSVPRPRLRRRLQQGLDGQHKLTLVSAPAGYGKTTLLAGWIADLQQQDIPTSWLALDSADNDLARFLRYWLAAFQHLDDAVSQSARSLLDTPQLPPVPAILDQLINDLLNLDEPAVLFLDDYHLIANPQIHEALDYFLDHQPPQLHLAITTRADPPFALSRLRVRGRLTEIRARDLRFTVDEARQFLNQSMNLQLDTADITALETRTEGWAAGLQLAALAMRNLPDRQQFLTEFSGSHRYIIDYLMDEVLKAQPAEIREFLHRTAVLPRFNADLCHAVTGSDAAPILHHLERTNLFLVPLDDQRGWYRYHHLFADVLRAGLTPETEPDIHARAARWFAAAGFPARAIHHWLAVPDPAAAAAQIRRAAADRLKRGELQTLLGWLEALPETAVAPHPDLIATKALCLLLTGQIDSARRYAGQARETLARDAPPAAPGRLLAVQAWFAMTDGADDTGDLARAALAQLPESDLFYRAITHVALGADLAWHADLTASSQVFAETVALGRQMENGFITLGGLANQAFNLLEQGELRRADTLCRAALDQFVDGHGRPLPILAIIYSPLAAICYEQGKFDEAQEFAHRGIRLSRRLFSNLILGGDSEIVLARIAFHRGRLQEALALLEKTERAARARNVQIVAYKTIVARADIHLLQGDYPPAARLLADLESLSPAALPKRRLIFSHLQARYLLGTGEIDDAAQILDELAGRAQEAGAGRWLMGILLSQALAAQRRGDPDAARRWFARVLEPAAQAGYVTLLIPHPGRPTRPLLQAARTQAPQLVDDVLALAQAPGPDALTAADLLPEPLTEQEQRVLELLADGRSNKEIAAELVISVGTAKWHVHNVLQKLEVSNRAQAAARAHELGLTSA